MNDYPDWVDLLRYLGLDPITVWVEYRPVLFVCIGIIVIAVCAAIYWVAVRVKPLIANYKFAFAEKMSFYRSLREIDDKDREAVVAALDGETMVYGMPAVAFDDVAGFHKDVGYVLLTKSQLIFTSGGKKISFTFDSFDDANVRDGKKHMELKLICKRKKPIFHLLGISRDHAQELFMKMHFFRVALKEQQTEPQ